MSYVSRKKLVKMLKDVKDIYERHKAPQIQSEVISLIQRRFISIGLQVDRAGSQEDASTVLDKIFEAFPKENVIGFSRESTIKKVENCEPAPLNPFLRPIPGTKIPQE